MTETQYKVIAAHIAPHCMNHLRCVYNTNRGKTTTQAIIQACKGMDSENKRINSC